MGMLVWVMVGLALWHFTVWLPDNFKRGIVGAFVGALLGSVIFGLLINLGVPGEAVPGALVGMALVYYEGVSRKIPALEL